MKTQAKLNPRFWRKQKGSALILTLGILALMLMLALSFAITSTSSKRSASASADLVRARMLAESGLERAMAMISTEFQEQPYPASEFFAPQSQSSPWSGRQYMFSTGTDAYGIQDALAVNLNGKQFTPNATLAPNTGWVPVKGEKNIGGQSQQVLIGRLAYLLIDESGKIDPSMAQEFPLSQAGIDFADLLKAQADGGRMPDNGRWFSASHLAKALNLTQEQMDAMVKSISPYSYDEEVFWRDSNNNDKWEPGEDEQRLDISQLGIGEGIGMDAGALYNAFVGPNKLSGNDDSAWLKELDNNPWVQNWATVNGISTVEAKRRIAAQIAVNIVDYADEDSVPTKAHITATGELAGGHSSVVGTYNVTGTERNWGFSELAVRVKADTWTIPQFGSGYTFSGDLNINPGNSDHAFELDTPDGLINRATLHNAGASFSYSGPASRVYIMAKSPGLGGTSCVINDVPYNLNTNTTYTFTGPFTHVNIYNTNPNDNNRNRALGNFWISINATNLTMVPDPGIPPKETKVVRITPEFKGEVFFPFATDADQDVPPSIVEVDYTVHAETDQGSATVIARKATLTIDQKTNYDGGTIMYSGDWHTGIAEIEDEVQIPFEVVNGAIVPSEPSQASVAVLGAAISYGGQYDMPVTVQVKVGANTTTPWGDWNLAVTGNVNDVNNPRTYNTPATVPAGTAISVSSKSWYKTSATNSGANNSHWQVYSTRSSNPATNYVKVLRDGDTVPQISAFLDQTEIASYVENYVEDGKIKLGPNQAIYLFEYVNDLNSAAADFQDLVVLVTLAPPEVDPDAIDPQTGIPHGTMAFNTLFSVPLVQINSITLKDADGNALVSMPSTAGSSYLCSWIQNGSSTGTTRLYSSIEATDVMHTSRSEQDSDFSTYWTMLPNTTHLSLSGQGTIGNRAGGGYFTSPYSGIQVKNAAFERIGEIGRVHSYQPLRSLRLWSANTAAQAGSDAAILDMFRTGTETNKRGKININTLQKPVLETLFAKAGHSYPRIAANALYEARQQGKVFTNIGEVFGAVAGITGSNMALDFQEEEAISKIADQLSVRQNFFTLIVTAQAVQDVGGIQYDSTGDGVLDKTAAYGQMDVRLNQDGSVAEYIDKVLAENKVMAIVYRDGLSNRMRVVQYEYLNE